jgi:hypothetical protein
VPHRHFASQFVEEILEEDGVILRLGLSINFGGGHHRHDALSSDVRWLVVLTDGV